MRILILLLGLFAAGAARAFALSPLVSSFAASEKAPSLTLENPTDEKIAVQIEFFERLQKDGAETREKTRLLSASPEQLVLKPHETRVIAMTWTGPDSLESERRFRIVVTQLPLFLKKDSPKTVFQIIGSVFVLPKGGKARRF